MTKKTAKLNFYKTGHTLTDNNDDKKGWRLKIGQERPKKKLGAICSNLDAVLNKSKITPQAYHGSSFIGNNCHSFFQKDVYKQLTRHLLETTDLD